MKHIAFAVVAAAALAVVGPYITPGYSQIEKPAPQSATKAAPLPTSLLRMRAGDGYPSRFDRR